MTETVRTIKSGLERVGLILADEKIEAVLKMNHGKKNTDEVEVGCRKAGYHTIPKGSHYHRGTIVEY